MVIFAMQRFETFFTYWTLNLLFYGFQFGVLDLRTPGYKIISPWFIFLRLTDWVMHNRTIVVTVEVSALPALMEFRLFPLSPRLACGLIYTSMVIPGAGPQYFSVFFFSHGYMIALYLQLEVAFGSDALKVTISSSAMKISRVAEGGGSISGVLQ